MIDTLVSILPQVIPQALGFLSPTGLAYTVVTSLGALVAHFTASAFVATTTTPAADTTWGKVYKIIEIIALAISKAKDK